MAEWIKTGVIWLSARLRMASLALLAVIALRAVASGLAPDAAPPPASAPIQAHNDSASQLLTAGDSSS
ncbi:hypothetical protein L2D00_02550 [Hyphomonadaceae bacterium BL14]|nr:hypothetical protein L2D00_02550 [Hyphomonadaceae bacterium BL14]